MSTHHALQRTLALLLCASLAVSGCATAGRIATAPAASATPDTRLIAEYVQKLPPGTTVRVDRVNGRGLRGTLIKATDDVLVLHLKTRLPEPPVEIRMAEVLRVVPDTGNGHSLAKAIGAGAAAGAGAALGVFLILIAIFSD